MKSIVLTGMMGSGKTTCARHIAMIHGGSFVDTDARIVERAGMSISDIFEQAGELAFRNLETEICRTLSGQGDLIIATGGGLILREENVAYLKKNGIFIFLNRPADEIYDTVSLRRRPLAQNGRDAFLRTFQAREACYRATADIIISDFSTVNATLNEIKEKMEGMR